MLIQLGPNRILGLQRLVDGVVDRMLLKVAIYGKPVPAAGVEPNAAALDFDAHVPEIRVTDHEVRFAIFGLGFPPYLGGPFRYADRLGAAEVVRRLEGFADRFGKRFEPAAILKEHATTGERFYPQ